MVPAFTHISVKQKRTSCTAQPQAISRVCSSLQAHGTGARLRALVHTPALCSDRLLPGGPMCRFSRVKSAVLVVSVLQVCMGEGGPGNWEVWGPE